MLARGDQLFRQGDMPGARAEYEKILEARPDVVQVHRSIAYTYGREGNHAKALEHIVEASRAAGITSSPATSRAPTSAGVVAPPLRRLTSPWSFTTRAAGGACATSGGAASSRRAAIRTRIRLLISCSV